MPNDALLQVEGLSVNVVKGSNVTPVLDDISFTLNAGQVLGVIGEAGSGKTVLSRALVNGLGTPLEISSGQVNYKGRNLLALSKQELRLIRGKEVGYIGANPMGSLDPTMAIGDQIVEKLRSVRPDMSALQAKDRVLDVLASVHIPSPATRFHEFPFQFSGGMMQRVMIVDALVTDPTFLVADNITQALDVTVAAQIIRLIDELREKFNTAIVFVSSSLPVVSSLADDILVLHEGKIVEQSSPEELINKPKHDYTKNLLTRLPKIWGSDVVAPLEKDGDIILSVRDVTKTYVVRKRGTFNDHNAVQAVRGLSFDIREGENFGIVGESGCGKSTLTRLLSWLEIPDAGTIEFQGRNLATLTPKELVKMRSSFQLLLQDPYNALPSRMPVGRIIAESLLIHGGGSKEEIRQKVLSAMDEVGLSRELENSLTVGLSAGQRQRVSIARALVLEPQLLILDETLSALDQVEQSQLLELFADLQEKHRFTYIFISHDMALVRKVCNRIAVMYLGKVVELASNSMLFDNPQHPYSKALLSAVPTLDDHPFQAEEYLLDGEPPSPVDIPQGCTFRSRCPSREDICGEQEPELEAILGKSLSACYFSGNKASSEGASSENGHVR